MLRTALSTCALSLVALSTATAQSFSFSDFASTAGLNLLGNAVQTGNTLQITNTVPLQTGWAWYDTPVTVLAGFDTTFTFRITPPASGLGEGMALVIQDDPAGANAMGGTIWGMGYGVGANGSPGIRNSVAVEFDTFLDPFLNDTSANELTIHTRGSSGNNENEIWSVGRDTPSQILSNGQVHTLRVTYEPGTLEVYVDGAATPAISVPYDFVSGGQYLTGAPAPGANMVNGTAFVGFCATTGANTGLSERVEILSWDWTSTPANDACYDGSIGTDTLTVEGSTGGFFRRVELATFQPFDIELADPPAFGPGAPYILFASLLPQPGALGTALGFGNTCFPVLPAGPTELVLADTIGLFPAILPAGPTPFTFAFPAGVVTGPLELTLQAVTFANSSPLEFGVTNAVELAFVPSAPPQITLVTPLSTTPGQTVTVEGTDFVPGVSVDINGTQVTPISTSATEIALFYPIGLPCGSTVTVTNPDGQSDSSPLNPEPTVTGTLLGMGPAAGNAIFIVQGTGFAPGTTATIGGAPAMIIGAGPSSVSMRTPPGTPGVAPVVLETPGGCTVSTTYTYQ